MLLYILQVFFLEPYIIIYCYSSLILLYYSYIILLILAYLFTLCTTLRILYHIIIINDTSFYLVNERWKDNWIENPFKLVSKFNFSSTTVKSDYDQWIQNSILLLWRAWQLHVLLREVRAYTSRESANRVRHSRLLTQLSLFTPNHRWHPPLEWSRHYNY